MFLFRKGHRNTSPVARRGARPGRAAQGAVGEPAEVSLAELGQGIPGYKGSGAFSRSQAPLSASPDLLVWARGNPKKNDPVHIPQRVGRLDGETVPGRSQIARMVSSKMPAGFGLSAVRDHLASRLARGSASPFFSCKHTHTQTTHTQTTHTQTTHTQTTHMQTRHTQTTHTQTHSIHIHCSTTQTGQHRNANPGPPTSAASHPQGFKEGSIAAILLHALALEPPARLGTVAEAHGWLRSVVQDYADLHGVSLSAAPPRPLAVCRWVHAGRLSPPSPSHAHGLRTTTQNCSVF